jgi:hypothetical protein
LSIEKHPSTENRPYSAFSEVKTICGAKLGWAWLSRKCCNTMAEKPHPLALALADLVRSAPSDGPRFVLALGGGSGRNIPPLLAAHLSVDILEEDPDRARALRDRFDREPTVRVAHGSYAEPNIFKQRYNAVLSTHALLHGSPSSISAAIQALKDRLVPDADLMLTLGSASDPRFGTGQRIDAQTWTPEEGPEAGVPHVYYDREEAHTLLRSFAVVSLREVYARDIVGSWAHAPDRTPGIVHWFAHVTNIPQAPRDSRV